MGSNVVVGAIILWIVPIFVAGAIGSGKNRVGWVYGIFLGWLGVLILALLPSLASPTLEDTYERMRRDPSRYTKKARDEVIQQLQAKVETQIATATRECPFCKGNWSGVSA